MWQVAIDCLFLGYHVVEDERSPIGRPATSLLFVGSFVQFPSFHLNIFCKIPGTSLPSVRTKARWDFSRSLMTNTWPLWSDLSFSSVSLRYSELFIWTFICSVLPWRTEGVVCSSVKRGVMAIEMDALLVFFMVTLIVSE